MPEDPATEAVRARYSATADRAADHADARVEELRERLRRFVHLGGDERVVDVGTGAAAVPVAIAPLVSSVVGVDIVPELLEEGRRRAAGLGNVELVEGDATKLPFDAGEFELGTCVRVLHHVRRPELAVAELTRVVRLGGRVLIVDQVAPGDPLVAIEVDRFERARDPSHQRLLPDNDIRFVLEMNGLVVERAEVRMEKRELDEYLDLAGCEGESRDRARRLAPAADYQMEVGWYLARRHRPR
jgi:SAM-dependent methyltransferase